jgi:hypothetical protein
VFLLRLVAILVVATVGSSIALFLLTGDRKYLKFALKLAKWAAIFALVLFAMLAFERLAVLI